MRNVNFDEMRFYRTIEIAWDRQTSSRVNRPQTKINTIQNMMSIKNMDAFQNKLNDFYSKDVRPISH